MSGGKTAPMPDGYAPLTAGATRRTYQLDIDDGQDDASIEIPSGAQFYAIRGNASALKVEVADSARVVDADGSSMIDTAIELAASAEAADFPMTPCKPGEFLNISHDDGSTAIGAFVLHLEGDGLPATAAALAATITDPGA